MTAELRTALLGSISAGNLAAMCGAGLSMGNPTGLPSAADLAIRAAERFTAITGHIFPADKRDDLEFVVGEIRNNHGFLAPFVSNIVPWEDFQRRPNAGHCAVADFLLCAALDVAVSTNYDTHIEDAAFDLGERDFRGVLDGPAANRVPARYKPLLKLHGCTRLGREETVWVPAQLTESPIQERIASAEAWLRGRLQGRDLVFLGFWSDWDYLNHIFTDVAVSLDARADRLVVLVDPADAIRLETKSPVLWSWANTNRFHHVRQPGEEFLDELRLIFSQQFFSQLHLLAKDAYEQLFGEEFDVDPPDFSLLTNKELYDLRRDTTISDPQGAVVHQVGSHFQ